MAKTTILTTPYGKFTFIDEDKQMKVKLEGRLIGRVKQVGEGYQYFPSGKKTGGDVFTKIQDCINSLISDDEEGV